MKIRVFIYINVCWQKLQDHEDHEVNSKMKLRGWKMQQDFRGMTWTEKFIQIWKIHVDQAFRIGVRIYFTSFKQYYSASTPLGRKLAAKYWDLKYHLDESALRFFRSIQKWKVRYLLWKKSSIEKN